MHDTTEKLHSNYPGRLRFRWKHEWAKVPSTRFVIKPLIVRHGLSLIYGEPKKAMKSTTVISMSCCIATGAPWCGFPVEKLRVLYVATEGFNGVLQRIEAWEQLHHRKVGNNLALLNASINFSTSKSRRPDCATNGIQHALTAFKAQSSLFEPQFIVLDTLGKSTIGANENDAGEMNAVFANMEEFQFQLNAKEKPGILATHHTTKDGMNYRGSSAILGAVDALILSESSGNQITLTCKAMKDARAFEPVTVQWDTVRIDTEEEGWQESLAVTKPVGILQQLDQFMKETEQHAHELVEIMLKHFPNGATSTQLYKQSGMTESTYGRARKCAVDEMKWIVGGGGRGKPYNLNPDGSWKQLPSPSPPTSTPLRGVEVMEVSEVTPMGANWRLAGGEGNTAGCKSADTTAPLKPAADETDEHARQLARVMYDVMDDTRAGLTYEALLKRSGMAEPAFGAAFKYGQEQDWFVEGADFARTKEYVLNFNPKPRSEGSELLKQAMSEPEMKKNPQ
jgi:hypothetical protein